MRYLNRYIAAAAAAVLAFTAAVSCTKYPDASYKETENRSLAAWMKKNRPELTGNFQEDGKYYVEVLGEGYADSASVRYVIDSVSVAATKADEDVDGCWVAFDITAYDLQGRVCLTRNRATARMQGTFTKFTHYVPYLRYIGSENISLLEGTYLAMKNELTLSDEYIAENGDRLSLVNDGKLEMRGGTKLRLYLPSSIAGGSTGIAGDGGYEGEYTLDGNRPMIIDIEITDRINNPVAYEGYLVDRFGEVNGGVSPIKEAGDDDEAEAASLRRFRRSTRADADDDEEEEEDDGNYWRHACDTIPGLLVSKLYVPSTEPGEQFSFDFTFPKDDTGASGEARFAPYADDGVYADMNDLNSRINQILLDRFGEGTDDGELVGTTGTAKIWYITRIFDGFIVDTNIDEVRELIYGSDDETSSHSSLSYNPESDKDDYVTAWYYTVPELRYGQWATILSTSTFAYGSSGRTGATTTSSSSSGFSYMPYLNMYGYYNSMYGYGYSDMYYYNMYNMYNLYGSGTTTTETTTEISSEIQPFTPLIFQIYIEEED